MIRLSWTEKKSNEEELLTSDTSRELIKTVRKRQLKFLGDTNRRSVIEGLAKKDRGRQRLTYLESLNKWAMNTSMGNNEFLPMSNNRKEWRVMIANFCSRSGT